MSLVPDHTRALQVDISSGAIVLRIPVIGHGGKAITISAPISAVGAEALAAALQTASRCWRQAVGD